MLRRTLGLTLASTALLLTPMGAALAGTHGSGDNDFSSGFVRDKAGDVKDRGLTPPTPVAKKEVDIRGFRVKATQTHRLRVTYSMAELTRARLGDHNKKSWWTQGTLRTRHGEENFTLGYGAGGFGAVAFYGDSYPYTMCGARAKFSPEQKEVLLVANLTKCAPDATGLTLRGKAMGLNFVKHADGSSTMRPDLIDRTRLVSVKLP